MGYNVRILFSQAEADSTIKFLEGSGDAALGHIAAQIRREIQQIKRNTINEPRRPLDPPEGMQSA